MVGVSITFIWFLLCAIIAQTVEVEAPKPNHSKLAYEEDNSFSYPEELVYPSLSCLLFKDIGCREECLFLGLAYGHKKTTGRCLSECSILVSLFGYKKKISTCEKEVHFCTCTYSTKNTLTSLWNERFDSKDILKQIKKNKPLKEEVHDILEYPFYTVFDVKSMLKFVLTNEQYNGLKLKDDIVGAEMMKNERLDSDAIKKFIAEKLPTTFNSADNETLSTLKLKPILFEALNEAKYKSEEQGNEAFNELVSNIRRTQNETLGDILTKYLMQNQFEELAEDEHEPLLYDSIASYVIDELVKVKITESKIKDDDSENISAEKTLQKNRFVLKNFNKNALRRSGPINQNWKRRGYEVQYERSEEGDDISIVWIKGIDKVKLQKNARSDVNQSWKFGSVYIKISKNTGGDINQSWYFGDCNYQYSRSAGGYVNSKWSSGKPNEEMLKMYQGFIDQWCRDNDFLIQRTYCVMYDK